MICCASKLINWLINLSTARAVYRQKMLLLLFFYKYTIHSAVWFRSTFPQISPPQKNHRINCKSHVIVHMIEYLLFSKLPVTAVHSPREVLKRVDSNFLEGEKFHMYKFSLNIASQLKSKPRQTHWLYDILSLTLHLVNTAQAIRRFLHGWKEYESFQP